MVDHIFNKKMSLNKEVVQSIVEKLNILRNEMPDYGGEQTPHINNHFKQFNEYLDFLQRQLSVNKPKSQFDRLADKNLVSLKQSRVHFKVSSLVQSERIVQIPCRIGIDNIDDLTAALRMTWNKLCETNFITLHDKLVSLLEQLNILPELTSNQLRIADVLFDMATHHRMYTEVYAKMWCTLASKFDFLHCRVSRQIPTYMKQLASIKIADPQADYNSFCTNNILKERIYATTKFIMHYAKYNPQSGTEIFISLLSHLMFALENEELFGTREHEEVLNILCIIIQEKFFLQECEDVTEWKVMVREHLKSFLTSRHSATLPSRIKFAIENALQLTSIFEAQSSWEIVLAR